MKKSTIKTNSWLLFLDMMLSIWKRVLISARPAIHRMQWRGAAGLTYFESKPPQSLGMCNCAINTDACYNYNFISLKLLNPQVMFILFYDIVLNY